MVLLSRGFMGRMLTVMAEFRENYAAVTTEAEWEYINATLRTTLYQYQNNGDHNNRTLMPTRIITTYKLFASEDKWSRR